MSILNVKINVGEMKLLNLKAKKDRSFKGLQWT